MKDNIPIVITTINKPTKGIKKFAGFPNCFCIIVGDKKTPSREYFDHKDIELISYNDQAGLSFELVNYLPDNHYCRKNIGYLLAIQNGNNIIAETDDDNIPYADWENMYFLNSNGISRVANSPKFVNVYKLFSNFNIWPRGFPLKALSIQDEIKFEEKQSSGIVIWQGLADDNPDVDAIFRLIYPNQKISFDKDAKPVVLEKGIYCPFNSQNTIWSKQAFPFLYLPLFVNFRFTDILRSYIAQRGIWELGYQMAFGKASVYQDRNYHDLLKDFEDEIDCYLQVEKVVKILDDCKLTGRPLDDLYIMYQDLNEQGVVVEKELDAVQAWINDIRGINNK